MTTTDMSRDEARDFLTSDGGRVPCSRYGRDSDECWPIAYAVAEIIRDCNGEPITEEALDYLMGLVVNDHDDIESLLLEHGSPEQLTLVDWLDT